MEVETQLASAAAFYRSCPLCKKHHTREHSYNRHVRYCRRAQTRRKGRPKSCLPCSRAKVKCSFASPCSRCDSRGLNCTYDQPVLAEYLPREAPIDLGSHSVVRVDGSRQPLDSTLSAIEIPQDGHSQRSPEYLESQYLSIIEEPTPPSSSTSGNPQNEQGQNTSSHGEIGHVHQLFLRMNTGGALTVRNSRSNPVARLVRQMVMSFPQMMLRRQTFPPFIHPHWQDQHLPEALASCMSIAQLFASRTPETRPFLWRTIDGEEKQLIEKMYMYSVREIFTSVQAMVIYLIMVLMDEDSGSGARVTRMTRSIKILCARFRQLLGGEYYCTSEDVSPSWTWEDWIFAESRRRFTWLWFILSISIEANLPVDDCRDLDSTPLMSNKMMWEARSVEEWQVEKAFNDASGPMSSLGQLMGAKRNPLDPFHAQRLQYWEVGSDKLSFKLSLILEVL